MKNLILSLLLSLFSLVSLSQKSSDVSNFGVYSNSNFDGIEVLTIENPLEGYMVFPMSEPTTFYLIDSKSKILMFEEKTKTLSFDSDDLQTGIYYLVLETPTGKQIYKLIK
jgi:MFS superfamily sulfate permease-like transporter